MKTIVRYLSAAATLGALLIFSGCDTVRTARAVPSRIDYQVTVVEKSKGPELTPQQVAELRASALNYLAENGLNRGGEYLLKVSLTPGQPEDTDQWVVLRISSTPARTYTLLAAYLGPGDFYPYDFYNYGYPGYSRYGYYDPFDCGYGKAGYLPSAPVPPRDHKPGDKDKHPPATHTRWDGNRPNPDRPHSTDHRDDGRDQPNDSNTGSSRSGHGNGDSSSTPRPAYNPPPAPVRAEPATRAAPTPQNRAERNSQPEIEK